MNYLAFLRLVDLSYLYQEGSLKAKLTEHAKDLMSRVKMTRHLLM